MAVPTGVLLRTLLLLNSSSLNGKALAFATNTIVHAHRTDTSRLSHAVVPEVPVITLLRGWCKLRENQYFNCFESPKLTAADRPMPTTLPNHDQTVRRASFRARHNPAQPKPILLCVSYAICRCCRYKTQFSLPARMEILLVYHRSQTVARPNSDGRARQG